MEDKTFLEFIASAGARKGAATFNLKTLNVSKQARDILSNTKFTALAKAHINGAIARAYNSNSQFRDKLDDVMAQLNIEVIK